MSRVHPLVWTQGHVLATAMPGAKVTYKTMNTLCEALHKEAPDILFDNREWLGRVHYLMFYGNFEKARNVFLRLTMNDGLEWDVSVEGDLVAMPQLYSQEWQDAQEETK